MRAKCPDFNLPHSLLFSSKYKRYLFTNIQVICKQLFVWRLLSAILLYPYF